MSVTLTAVIPVAKKEQKRLQDVDEPQSERIEIRVRPAEKQRWESMVRRKGAGSLAALMRIVFNEYCDLNEQEDKGR